MKSIQEQIKDKMIPILIPLYSVGDFIIKSNIEKYLNIYSFEIDDYSTEAKVPSIHYSIYSPKITLFVENSIIEDIACYEELLYKSKNLIGMNINEFISHVGENFIGDVDTLDFEEDNIPQFIYEFETIGLQVWVKGENGKIVTIIVSSLFE